MKNILDKKELENIKAWCESLEITNYTINSDGSVDIQGDISIDSETMDNQLQFPIKLNIVDGNMIIQNAGITSLINMPHTVNGNFQASNCDLISLEGCPKIIKGDFDFTNNSVSSFWVGNYDVYVGGDIYTSSNDFKPFNIFMQFLCGFNEEDYDDDPYNDWGDVECDVEVAKVILSYQRHFEIWDTPETLNEKNFKELIDEFNDGLR
jgi:hypothetical protein